MTVKGYAVSGNRGGYCLCPECAEEAAAEGGFGPRGVNADERDGDSVTVTAIYSFMEGFEDAYCDHCLNSL